LSLACSHRRVWRKHRLPLLRQVLLPIAILDYRNYRDELGRSNRTGESSSDEMGASEKRYVRFLTGLLASTRRKI